MSSLCLPEHSMEQVLVLLYGILFIEWIGNVNIDLTNRNVTIKVTARSCLVVTTTCLLSPEPWNWTQIGSRKCKYNHWLWRNYKSLLLSCSNHFKLWLPYSIHCLICPSVLCSVSYSYFTFEVTLEDLTIANTFASTSFIGDGISHIPSVLLLLTCLFEANAGAAVYARSDHGKVIVNNVIFMNSSASSGAAIMAR